MAKTVAEPVVQVLGTSSGDRDLLLEQMTFYLEDSPILIRDIENAIKQEDHKKLEMSAHRMRGLSVGFDVMELVELVELVELAAKLEEMGRDAELSDAAETLHALRKSWNPTCEALQEHISGRPT